MNVLFGSKLLAAMLPSFLTLCSSAWSQQDYPSKPIEVMVAFQPGGGTDPLARAYADAAKKFTTQPVVVYNKPGASGAIGLTDVVNAKADDYKIAMLFVEVTILPHLGITKITQEDFIPIARQNADPAAITVKADALWNTIEAFLVAAKKRTTKSRLATPETARSGIWLPHHWKKKTGARFNHIPFQGAGPRCWRCLAAMLMPWVSAPRKSRYLSPPVG